MQDLMHNCYKMPYRHGVSLIHLMMRIHDPTVFELLSTLLEICLAKRQNDLTVCFKNVFEWIPLCLVFNSGEYLLQLYFFCCWIPGYIKSNKILTFSRKSCFFSIPSKFTAKTERRNEFYVAIVLPNYVIRE